MFKRYKFLIKTIMLEVSAMIFGIVLAYNLNRAFPTVEGIEFDRAIFNASIISLNIGLIFAVFLAIFISDSSHSVQDARKHPAFSQPLFVIILNSILLCITSAFSTDIEWVKWSLVFSDIIFVVPNIKMMWDLVLISRKS